MNTRALALAFTLVSAAAASSNCKSSNSPKTGSASAEAAESEESGPSAQERFVRGNEHLDAGEFEDAIQSYESAVEQDPKRWDAWLNLAIAHSKSNQFTEAIDAIEQCLANGGAERPEVYFNLGNIYQKRGLYRQALKAYRTSRAYAEQPDVDTLVNMGATLAIMNRPEDAHEMYEKAQKLAPQDPRVQHGIAVALHLKGKHRESIQAYDQLLSMDPDYTRAHYDKAQSYVHLEEFRNAIDTLETYLEKAPDGRFASDASDKLKLYRKKLENSSSSR